MQPDNNKASKTLHKQGARKVRWWQIMLIVAAGLLVLVSGALLWLLNDTARVKGAVETLVSTLTNRPFHINGEFDFTLGSEINVSASQIVWDNAAWSSQPTMLTVENVQASVDFRSILEPPILITNVVASNARLDFEWSPDNVSNWYLANPDKPPEEEPANPLPLLLDKTNLKNVAIHVKHPSLTDELVILIETADQQQDESNRLVATINTLVDGRKIKLDGRIGPFPELIIAGAVDFDISATGPNANMSIKGDFDNLASLEGPDIDLDFTAPEFADVLDILNLPEVTRGPADLKGSFRSDEGKFAGKLQGSVGEFNLDGAFEAASLSPLQDISAHLVSQGPSARAAGNTVGLGGLPGEPYKLSIKLVDQDDGIKIEEVAYESAGAVIAASGLIRGFPVLSNLDLELKVDAENIARYGDLLPGDDTPAVPFNLKASIQSNTDGDKDSLKSTARLGQLEADVSGLLTEDPDFVGSHFNFSATVPDSKQLGATLGLPILKTANITLRGEAGITPTGVDIKSASGAIGTHNYSVKGELPLHAENLQLQFDTNIDGPDLADLVSIFAETDRVPGMPYRLGGTLSFATNRLTLKPISGSIGDNKLSTNGTLEFGDNTLGIDLQFSVDGKDLGSVLQTQGIEGGPAKPYSVSARLAMADDAIRISALDFNTSDDQLQGAITVARKEGAPLINFDLSSKGANLQALLPDIPGYQPAAVPFDVQAKGNIEKEQVHIPQLSAKFGTASLTLSGTLNLPPNLKATGIQLKATGPNLSDLGTPTGWGSANVPFSIAASMGGTTNYLEASDFNITIGASDLRGAFNLNIEDKPEVELQLNSNVLDIRALQKNLQRTSERPEQEPDEAKPVSKDQRLIPDEPIPADMLNSVNGTVKVRIGQMLSQRSELKAISIDGTLRDGKLDIPNFSASTQKGRLQSEIHVFPTGAQTGVEVTATAKNLVLAIGELDDELRKNHPGQDVDLHLTSQGDTYRTMASGLNGYIWFRGGERQIRSADLGILFGDFLSEVFESINPFAKKDPYQTMECDRIFFEIVDGVAQTSPAIFMRTDKLNITAVGAVNLTTEKLDFAIETSPRKGIGLSAGDLVNPFVKVSGTMAKPGLALDPAGTLIEGGAAVATMGISMVAKSMYKRWLGPREPCAKLTEQAREIRKKQDPTHVPAD